VAPVGIFTPKLQPRYRSGTYERHLVADHKKAPEFRLWHRQSGGAPLFQDGGSIDAFVPMNCRSQGDV